MDLRLYNGILADQYELTHLNDMVKMVEFNFDGYSKKDKEFYIADRLNIFKLSDIPLYDEEVISLFNKENGLIGIDYYESDFMKNLLSKVKINTIDDIVRINNLSRGTGTWEHNAKNIIDNVGFENIITSTEDIVSYLTKKNIDEKLSYKVAELVERHRAHDDNKEWLSLKNKLLKLGIEKWFLESCEKIEFLYNSSKSLAYAHIHYYLLYFKVYYPEIFYKVTLNKYAFAYDKDIVLKGKAIIKEELKNKNKSIDEITIYNVILEMLDKGYEFIDYNLFKSDTYSVKISNKKVILPLDILIVSYDNNELGGKLLNESELKPFKDIDDLVSRLSITNKELEELKSIGII